MIYAVITKVPNSNEGDDGNLYHASVGTKEFPDSEIFIENERQTNVRPVNYKDVLLINNGSLMLPLFYVGEILVLDDKLGREVSGRRRCPRKWFVDVEHFRTLRRAVARAKQVTEEHEQWLHDRFEEQLNAVGND